MVQRAVVSLLAALVAVALASCSTSGRKDAADSVARQRGFRICFAVAAVDGFGGRNGFWASRDDIRKDPEVARRVSQEFYRVVRHSLPNTDPDEAFLGCADAIVGGWPPDVPVSASLASGRTTETATAGQPRCSSPAPDEAVPGWGTRTGNRVPGGGGSGVGMTSCRNFTRSRSLLPARRDGPPAGRQAGRRASAPPSTPPKQAVAGLHRASPRD